MRRRLTIGGLVGGLIAALALVLSPAQPTSAQQDIVWSTGFQVQNLGLGSATITIDLIGPTGNTVATINSTNDPNGSNPIPQGGGRTYFPVPLVSAPFSGSAIISANQPIAAILNITGNAGVPGQPFYSGSASGVSEGSPSVMLPLIMRNNAGYSTWFAVQNVGTADATVEVQFTTGGAAGTSYKTTAITIKKGASYTYDQLADANLGPWFVGSAVVTSTNGQNLAVIVNQVGKTVGKQTMLTYTGFPLTSASNSIALPMIQQANGGTSSGISVQNAGTVPASVTITYSTNLVSGAPAMTADSFSLPVNGSMAILKTGTAQYVGSARVTTASSDQKVVAIVNQVTSTTGSAYEGMNVGAATPKVSLPLLMTNGGFITGVQCINVGGATTEVTLTYNPNTAGNGFNPSNFVKSNLAVGESFNVLQNFAQQYVGGGTISTNPASNIMCMVNEVKPNSGNDALLTYDGINYQ